MILDHAAPRKGAAVTVAGAKETNTGIMIAAVIGIDMAASTELTDTTGAMEFQGITKAGRVMMGGVCIPDTAEVSDITGAILQDYITEGAGAETADKGCRYF